MYILYFRYCDTINNIVHVVQQKQIFPWLQHEILFNASPLKKVYDEALYKLQKFTKDVISEKRKIYEQNAEVDALPKEYFRQIVNLTYKTIMIIHNCLIFMLIKISISTKSPAKPAERRNNVQNINNDAIFLGDVYDGKKGISGTQKRSNCTNAMGIPPHETDFSASPPSKGII